MEILKPDEYVPFMDGMGAQLAALKEISAKLDGVITDKETGKKYRVGLIPQMEILQGTLEYFVALKTLDIAAKANTEVSPELRKKAHGRIEIIVQNMLAQLEAQEKVEK